MNIFSSNFLRNSVKYSAEYHFSLILTSLFLNQLMIRPQSPPSILCLLFYSMFLAFEPPSAAHMLQAGLGVTHCGSIVNGNGISLAVTGIQTQLSGQVLGRQLCQPILRIFFHMSGSWKKKERAINTSPHLRFVKKQKLEKKNPCSDWIPSLKFVIVLILRDLHLFFFLSVQLHLIGVAFKPKNVLL